MINKVLIVVAIPTFFILILFKTADTKKEVVINKIPNFLLIGTISSQDSHKALIKNKDTGVLRAYHKGDSIYSVNNKPIKIISINNCGITIDNLGKKEYLHCKKTKSASRANLSPYIPTPLARFKISLGQKVLKDDEFFSRFDNDINYFSIKNGIDPRLVKAVINNDELRRPEHGAELTDDGLLDLASRDRPYRTVGVAALRSVGAEVVPVRLRAALGEGDAHRALAVATAQHALEQGRCPGAGAV